MIESGLKLFKYGRKPLRSDVLGLGWVKRRNSFGWMYPYYHEKLRMLMRLIELDLL
jgi:hypothetical protein